MTIVLRQSVITVNPRGCCSVNVHSICLSSGPLVLVLLNKFSYRPIMLTAGIVATVGYLVAAVSQSFAVWSVSIITLAGTSVLPFSHCERL